MFQTCTYLYSSNFTVISKESITDFYPLLISPGEWSYANRESTVTVPFGCVLREVFCSCVSDFYSRDKRVATWSSRCALKSLCRHTYYIAAVCLLFAIQIRKHRCDSYKKRRPCVLSNISIVAISVGLPVVVNNPVPASQVGFQQFRAIWCFCIEGSNKRSDRGHFSNDWELFNDRTFKA